MEEPSPRPVLEEATSDRILLRTVVSNAPLTLGSVVYSEVERLF